MNRLRTLLLIVSLLGTAVLARTAPGGAAEEPRATGEPLTAWEWFQELQLPEPGAPRYFDFLLTPGVFDKARADLADLRLYDGQGREIPYALRVRRAQEEREPLPAKEFNRSTNADR